MQPDRIYYEEPALIYPLGKMLADKFADAEWIPIESHNRIPELQSKANSEFPKMKRHLVIGIRKTHKYVPNHKTSDFLVPYTSSGCSAMCLYCYLVCNYNKCSYLRLFVNREQMMDKLIKKARAEGEALTFEIGSNSDLVLENTITGNLEWTIERFGKEKKGFLTLPTKFHMIDSLLPLPHGGRTILRMSVNPQEIIRSIELGTSPLEKRIEALNALCQADYPIGLLIAPVVLVEDWQRLYQELLDILHRRLSAAAKKKLFIEVIFMTYSYVHHMINQEAFPNRIQLYNKEQMTGRGRGKYCYRPALRQEGEAFLRDLILQVFSPEQIAYIV